MADSWANAIRYAFALMTRLPIPPGRSGWASGEAVQGRSVAFFPLVGLVIGGLLVLVSILLAETTPWVVAALMLLVWVLLTGALHLDGLADSADAWLGGLGDRERTLAIMKDPASGPAGVTVLVMVLLLKFAALASLLAHPFLILLAPVIGRAAVSGLLLTTPYVREGGLGSAMARALWREGVVWSLAAVAIVCVLLGWVGVLMLLLAGVLVLGLRRLMLDRLGGVTGDTLGASVEIVEAGVLIAAVIAL